MAEQYDLDIDIESLTVGEMEDIEAEAGLSYSAILRKMGEEDAPKGRILRAFAYVLRRRVDPEFTREQARELRFMSVRLTWGAAEPDPTEPPSSTPIERGAA